ncbi:MAG: SpoIID/LytB domain-containing protein [Candidatus Limivivens sp.]|nr:SpoIID/LytB domain-containing protein [Candidatus Limivivens sp.]
MKREKCCWLLLGMIGILLIFTCLRHEEQKKKSEVPVRQDTGAAETGSNPEQDTEKVEAVGTGEESERKTEATETASVGKMTSETEIRVLIRSDSFESLYHQEERIAFQTAYTCSTDSGRSFSCEPGSEFVFPLENSDGMETVWNFEPTEGEGSFSMPLLKRGYDHPVYHGSLTVTASEEGYLFRNTVDLETYLCAVVPSEMPARYPSEALKAQAVCARTYAYSQLGNGRLADYEADVDDSVEFQVYNNFPEDSRSSQAVEGTKGIRMLKNGELVDARYYSTSCGIDLTRDLSEEAVFCAFLSDRDREDYEKDEPWYRWNTFFTLEQLTRLSEDAGYELGQVTELSIGSREESGCVSVLRIQGTKGSREVSGEYAIRKFLKPLENPVTLQNGETAPDLGMLPSAFFYLTEEKTEEALTGYAVVGGGYGHGIGMSQNGAMHMAEAGESFEAILKHYYGEVTLYEEGNSAGQTISEG